MKNYILTLLLLLLSALPLTAHQSFNVSSALQSLQKGDLEAAEMSLQKARFADPENPVIAYNLGIVNYRKRLFAKAAQHFMQASAIAGSDELRFNSLYNLGNSAFKSGDYALAVSAYDQGLELKKDYQAEYNRKVAEEKLKKQLEEQQQQKEQQQAPDKDKNQQQQQGQDGQKKQQDGQQNQDGQENNKAGDQPKDGENQQQQQANGENEQKNEQNNAQNNEQNNEQNQQANADDKKSEENDDAESSDAQKQGDKDKESAADKQKQQQADNGNQENASQTQQLSEQAGADDQKERQDTEMADAQPKAPEKPEASQRARALKNTKVNPYMIEKILKEMERREHEAQVRARNEGVRGDDEDPFTMDADQLRQWMEQRRRPKKNQDDEPDW